VSSRSWLQDQRAELASERILDAAAELFFRQGIAETSMDDVARAAGCSRATVYRYFDDREALRIAFVHRETRRIGTAVGAAVAGIADPTERVIESVMLAVAAVRSQPTLHAWFASANTEITREIVSTSSVIHHLAAGVVAQHDDPDRCDRARWLVRTVVSLLLIPGGSAAEERRLVERFVAPVVIDSTQSPPGRPQRRPNAPLHS
jgi:AcrR family transcriptional regulator